MKKYKLYYISNVGNTTPIYVGVTGASLKERLKKHTCKPYNHKNGKFASGMFHNQKVEIHLIKEFEERWVALEAEGAFKLFLGIDWSERTKFDGGFAPKLTHQQVREIREKRKEGRSMTSLGEEYGIHKSAVRKIVQGITYKYVR